MRLSLRARLILTFGGLTLLAVVGFALVIAGTLERLLLDRLSVDLSEQAGLVGALISDDLVRGDHAGVARGLSAVDSVTSARVIVVDARGASVGSSEPELRAELGAIGTQIGLSTALQGAEARGILRRQGPQSEVLYVAIPVYVGERIVGAVRVSYQLRDIEQTIGQLNLGIALGAAATAGIAAILAAWFAGAITVPVRALSRAAQALAAGNLNQQVATSSDDEVGRLVVTFNDMAERLRELEDARREFASDISHELHSLAGAMQTAATALERGADQDAVLRNRLVTGLVGHTGRLGRLADDLLELAQLERGMMSVTVEPVSLVEIAQQTIAEWSAEAEQRSMRLDLDVRGDPCVLGDHERLVQACGNLVENALKYTEPGGRVVVRVATGGETNHLDVLDNGQGIPQEELPFIFHRFYRVEGRAAAGPSGMGLGLAIVDRIIRAHGGTISVTSTIGLGSQFHIRLPAVSGAARSNPESSGGGASHASASSAMEAR
jgi:signal transduction histidine kinase